MPIPSDPFGNEPKGQIPPKKPEFIIIDESKSRYQEHQTEFEPFRSYGESLKTKEIKYPSIIRLIFILAALCALGWIIGTVMCTLIFSLLACLTFFQSKQLNAFALKSWNYFKIALIGFISALIALFSPPLGLGLFLLFFTLRPESEGENFIQRIVKTYYNKM